MLTNHYRDLWGTMRYDFKRRDFLRRVYEASRRKVQSPPECLLSVQGKGSDDLTRVIVVDIKTYTDSRIYL